MFGKFSSEKWYLYQQCWKCHLWHVNVYFIGQNIMQRGDSMELNFEVLEIQKLNIPKDRAQRIDEKIGIICLVIMIPLRVLVIKMSKMTHFGFFY